MEMPNYAENVNPLVDQPINVEAPKVEGGDLSVEQGIENPTENVDTAPADEVGDILLKKEADLSKAEEVKQSIISSMESQRERWRPVLRKPEKNEVQNSDKPERKESFISGALRRAKSMLGLEKDERGEAEIISQFEQDVKKYQRINFNYEAGAGVEGWTTHGKSILANGFFDCSALTFQKDDFVSVLHLSPNINRDPSEGGELVQDYDYTAHIASALRGILGEEATRKTSSGDKLSEKEIRVIQELIDSNQIRLTMLMGEHQHAPEILARISSGLDPALPTIKPEVYSVEGLGGESGYSVYIDPKSLYVIGGNNRIIKKGVNFPDQMYDYQKV